MPGCGCCRARGAVSVDSQKRSERGPKPDAVTGPRTVRRTATATTTGEPMGFDQYHEPPDELPPATRTFARLCASLTEEAEAIGWYEQRIAVETDPEALAVM